MSDTMPSGTQIQLHPPLELFPDAIPTVPGYNVSREIARGGMGVVYAAHDPAFDREVAVKVMHAGQDAERFVIESKVTAQLPHPGIPPVYTLGTVSDGRPFLTMKLIQGRTLGEELKSATRADLPRLLGVFEVICQTIGFGHSRGIVHRDLKPANVMVGAFGEVLVMDWGIAKSTGSEQPRSEGTPAYMAPEQARGESVDPPADVFALGGILAVVITGRPPFIGDTAKNTVEKAARAELGECFTALDASGVDADIVAIAKKCLAPRADDRYAHGEGVATAMAAYRIGVEERLRRAERDRAASEAVAREQRKRRKVQLALAGAVMLLLCGGGLFAWWQDRQVTERKIELRLTEARLEGERDKERDLKAQQAHQGIDEGLKLATNLRKQFKFKEAIAALLQAEKLADGGASGRLAEVRQAQANLTFVMQLDDIRYRKTEYIQKSGGGGHFNTKIAPPEYSKAFTARALNLETLDVTRATNLIAESPIKNELVAAVDDWGFYETNPLLRERLLAIARAADPGRWKDRLRDPVVRKDSAAVKKLATDAAADLSAAPATLSTLATLMWSRGLDPSELLEAARVRHPDDFELAFTLGQWHTEQKDGKRIGPYEAARALRPDNVAVWINLGIAFYDAGDLAAAAAAYKEAGRLNPTATKAYYNLGLALKEMGDPNGAVEAFKEAIKHDPEFIGAHDNLGAMLGEKGDWVGAVAVFKETIRLQPTDPHAHANLGLAFEHHGDQTAAVAAYQEAIRLDPKGAKFHIGLGNALSRKADRNGAIGAYKEAIRLDPASALAHYNLGNMLKDNKDWDEAAAAYREAIRLDPKDFKIRNNLGTVLTGKGDWEGAAIAFKEAIALNSKEPTIYQNLGNALSHTGNRSGAVAVYREWAVLDPANAVPFRLIGGELYTKRDLHGAIAAFKQAVKRDPKDAGTFGNLGIALNEAEDWSGAVAALKEAIRLDPKLPRAHQNLGLALYSSGDWDGAVVALQEAIRLDPDNSLTHTYLGMTLVRKGDRDGAIAAYKVAVRLDPKNAKAHNNLGANYLLQKKYPEALVHAREAVKADPNYANAYALLGDLLLRGGDVSGARVALTEAARLDPKRWTTMLASLPPLDVAPPPREVPR